MPAKSIRHMRKTLVERELGDAKPISELERLQKDFDFCSKMVEKYEDTDRHEYWCDKFDKARDGLFHAEEEQRLINELDTCEENYANAKVVEEEVYWHNRVQSAQYNLDQFRGFPELFCTCSDEAFTGLTTSPPPCAHCEKQELGEITELYH